MLKGNVKGKFSLTFPLCTQNIIIIFVCLMCVKKCLGLTEPFSLRMMNTFMIRNVEKQNQFWCYVLLAERQSQLQQTTNFLTSFLIFEIFVIFEKQQNLKLSSAADYRWGFKG